MAQFKHLGSFGQPRDRFGLGSAADIMTAKAKGKSVESDSALKSKALEAEVASATVKQQNKDKEYGLDILTQFSMKWNRMSPEEQENFTTSDHYKNLQKLFKKTVPEMVDKDGNILTFADKTMFKDQLEKVKGQLMEKVRKQQKLSAGESKTLDFLTRYRTDDVSEVSSELERVYESKDWNDKQRAFELERRLKIRKEARQNEYSSDLQGKQPSLDFSDPSEWLKARGLGGGVI